VKILKRSTTAAAFKAFQEKKAENLFYANEGKMQVFLAN